MHETVAKCDISGIPMFCFASWIMFVYLGRFVISMSVIDQLYQIQQRWNNLTNLNLPFRTDRPPEPDTRFQPRRSREGQVSRTQRSSGPPQYQSVLMTGRGLRFRSGPQLGGQSRLLTSLHSSPEIATCERTRNWESVDREHTRHNCTPRQELR